MNATTLWDALREVAEKVAEEELARVLLEASRTARSTPMIDEDGDENMRSPSTTDAARKPRGFAAMEPKLVSELAKRGGKAAHRAGTAHQFTSEEARVAGRKGGMATHAKRTKHETGTPN